MEFLRDLPAAGRPAPPVAAPVAPPVAPSGGASAPAVPASRRFSQELFEEGARAGQPWLAALMDSAAPGSPAASGGDLPLDLDRWQPARVDDAPRSEFGLADFLDIINPLQHIPIVANMYRWLSGDTISGPARIAGAGLYGGPIGMVAGIVSAIAAEINGKDLGDSAIAALLGDEETPAARVGVAKTAPEPVPGPVPERPETTAAHAAAPARRPAHLEETPAPAQDPALTGNAALGALYRDLRAADQGTPPRPAAATAQDLPAPALDAAEAGPDGAAPPRHAFTRRMAQGLEKYQTMAIARGGAGRPAPRQLDRSL